MVVLKNIVLWTIFCFALLLATSPALAFSGKVVSITDGDTIKVLCDNKVTKIRLANIDCPEHNQAFGQKAKEFTSSYVFGQLVDVDDRGQDRYGRVIGEVSVPGKSVDLNHALVKNGLAWVYKQYCDDSSFYPLELAAHFQHRGLWADPDPVPPWEFRKYEKLHRQMAQKL